MGWSVISVKQHGQQQRSREQTEGALDEPTRLLDVPSPLADGHIVGGSVGEGLSGLHHGVRVSARRRHGDGYLGIALVRLQVEWRLIVDGPKPLNSGSRLLLEGEGAGRRAVTGQRQGRKEGRGRKLYMISVQKCKGPLQVVLVLVGEWWVEQQVSGMSHAGVPGTCSAGSFWVDPMSLLAKKTVGRRKKWQIRRPSPFCN